MSLIREDVEYYMVNSPSRVGIELTEDVFHHKLTGSNGYWLLEISLMNKPHASPLHIGTGDYETDEKGLYQPLARFNNIPCLNGAGFKGAVRSYAEALSPSCELNKENGNKCQGVRYCICCRLFGHLGYLGRVSFSDSLIDGNNYKLFKVGVPLRWGGTLTGGRRFYWHSDYKTWAAIDNLAQERLEVLGPSAVFNLRCHIQNASAEELGLLLLAMGAAPGKEFPIKIGGGKNRGLGSVWIKIKQDSTSNNESVLYRSFEQQPSTPDPAILTGYVESYLESLQNGTKKIVLENVDAFQRAFLEKEKIKNAYPRPKK